MNNFKLSLGTSVQGTFDLKPTNIAFVFQVNCPGCFIYGIPTMNQLHSQYKEEVGFIGVSTAFEDFEFNNIANTELLLKEGIPVGETKKYLLSQGESTYKHLPEFPISFDKMSNPEGFLTEENIENLVKSLTGNNELATTEQSALEENIKQYYAQYPKIAETFTLNQMRGTPSFVIFSDKYKILEHSFGQQSLETLERKLKSGIA